MKKCFGFIVIVLGLLTACQEKKVNTDVEFDKYKEAFVLRLWEMHPGWASGNGYHKYDSVLVVPNKARQEKELEFVKKELEQLGEFNSEELSEANQIDLKLMRNYLDGNLWEQTHLKSGEWNPSNYNVCGGFAEMLGNNYAPLDERLKNFSIRLKNVYWKVEGAADISTNSIFRGTLICNNAAIGNSGVLLDGRALITTGALSTNASIAIATMIPTNCATLGLTTLESANIISIYPNPFSTSTTIEFADASQTNNSELYIYDILGAQQLKTVIRDKTTTLDTNQFPSGVYYYKLINSGVIVQTGKLIAQ